MPRATRRVRTLISVVIVPCLFVHGDCRSLRCFFMTIRYFGAGGNGNVDHWKRRAATTTLRTPALISPSAIFTARDPVVESVYLLYEFPLGTGFCVGLGHDSLLKLAILSDRDVDDWGERNYQKNQYNQSVSHGRNRSITVLESSHNAPESPHRSPTARSVEQNISRSPVTLFRASGVSRTSGCVH